MKRGQPVSGLCDDLGRLAGLETFGAAKALGQSPPLDEFHHQIGQGVRRIDHDVDHRQVIVLDAGRGLGLPGEARPRRLVGEARTQHFDGYRPSQRGVVAAEDDAHPAPAHLGLDPVRP
jgi:hypothetical protein